MATVYLPKDVSCSYCSKDVSGSSQCYFKCANDECAAIGIQLCTDCFSSGVTLMPHVKSHPYKVVDCLEFPIFTKEWSAAEELSMLEAIEKVGVGNWKVVSEQMAGSKTARQLEEHYWELFMGVHAYCLPAKYFRNDELVAMDSEAHSAVAVGEGYSVGEEVLRDKGKDARNVKSNQDVRDRIAVLPGGDLAGFIPLREDFELEHDNDAEVILADMEFLPDDHPSEVALKKSIIRIYNAKLTERDRRKKFVIMHGHIDFKKLQAADKRRSKGERELVGRLRMFARFQTPAEHEALVEGLIRAQRLKEQINNLKLFRKMGIKTLEQARQYEIDRKKRENDNKNKNKLDPNLSNSKLSSMAYNRRSRGDVDDAAADITGGGSNKQKGGSGSSVLYSSVGKGGARVDISAAPSAGLLSREELELCAELPLLPAHYIAAKDTIIREAFRSGSVTKEGVMRVIKLEPNSTKADQIYDFFARELSAFEEALGSPRKKQKTLSDSAVNSD